MSLIGSLISFPFVILFYLVWILASLIRPLITLSLVCVLSKPSAALRKGQLLVSTITYLLFCKDKTWKHPDDDPDSFLKDPSAKIDQKTIFFVRHGESLWNETFNKGDRPLKNFILYFIPNLLKSIGYEWYFWVSGQDSESWFFDSPLSGKGRKQSESIQTFLRSNLDYVTPKEAQLIRLLNDQVEVRTLGTNQSKNASASSAPKSKLVCSNLRRALATVAIGFQDRLQRNSAISSDDDAAIIDMIEIWPSLQEISRNPDALSITAAKGPVEHAWVDPPIVATIYKNQVDARHHTGNKPVSSNGLKRLEEFCSMAFSDSTPEQCIVAGGHSLWFRSFFKTYLPYSVDHVCKKKKLVNGAIVAFTLQRIQTTGHGSRYRVDPTTITVLHGGF